MPKQKSANIFSSSFLRQKSLVISFVLLFAAIGGFFIIRSYALTPPTTGQAVMYITPSSGAFKGTLNVAIRVNGAGEKLNAIDAFVRYPSDKLQYVGVNNGYSSFADAVVTKNNILGHEGELEIVRGSINPCSADCQITWVQFKVKPGVSGEADINYTVNSKALNTSQANKLRTLQSGIFTVSP